MNIKPKMDITQPLPAVEEDERDRDATDSFIARNRDALNDSIRQGRTDLAAGRISARTIDDIIADGRRKFGNA